VFFTNSGAEAIEARVKTARRYHFARERPSASASSRSRALSTAARWRPSPAGGQAKYLEGFGPKVEGFDQVPFGDRKALEAAIGPDTAAVLIEPIQGEGGIRPVPPEDLRTLRQALRRPRSSAGPR
jgi:acetylornithine/N-succinyldiaminopimelate aminotransferase